MVCEKWKKLSEICISQVYSNLNIWILKTNNECRFKETGKSGVYWWVTQHWWLSERYVWSDYILIWWNHDNQKCHLDEGHRDESSITLQTGYFFVHRKKIFFSNSCTMMMTVRTLRCYYHLYQNSIAFF